MLIDQVLAGILQKLPGQTFSIKKMSRSWTLEEKARFEDELEYLSENYTMEAIVNGYVYFTGTVLEETKYFREHGRYRYSSFDEVNRNVYSNEQNMTSYMLGLSLAEYLWETTLRIHRFFENEIRNVCGDRYLEIGPGHGKYFREAYELGRFKKYVGVDVSQTAISMTECYMKRCKAVRAPKDYELICQDALSWDTREKFDFIVIQEVLEHLEDPLGMLKKLNELLTPDGNAYLLMPICAPSAQHIFLFRDTAHVRGLVEQANLKIMKEEYIAANSVAIDTAEKKKLPINACLIVKKK